MNVLVFLIDLILHIDVVDAMPRSMCISLAGYLFSNIPVVKDNLKKVLGALILVSSDFAMVAAGKSRRSRHGV